MRHLKIIVIALLSFINLYANKDRMSLPKTFEFTYENKEFIKLDANDSKLKFYSNEIVSGKRKVSKAKITFKSGEIFTAIHNGKNWTSIIISYKEKDVAVPREKVKKISEINFTTLELVWSSNQNEAFNASYFILEFELGNIKYFDKLPRLNINFEKQKYSNCVIWNPTENNAMQWSNF
jgi:hypothetical protein